MLTKGIIISKIVNSNKYLVRIPFLETSGFEKGYYEATLSNIPGIYEEYLPNDVVIVGFEDHDGSKPIIIGKLYLNENETRGIVNVEKLNVSTSVNLPEDLTINGYTLDSIIGNAIEPLLNETPTPPVLNDYVPYIKEASDDLTLSSLVFTYDYGKIIGVDLESGDFTGFIWIWPNGSLYRIYGYEMTTAKWYKLLDVAGTTTLHNLIVNGTPYGPDATQTWVSQQLGDQVTYSYDSGVLTITSISGESGD